MHDTCPTHIIFLDVITETVFWKSLNIEALYYATFSVLLFLSLSLSLYYTQLSPQYIATVFFQGDERLKNYTVTNNSKIVVLII
jgi:hypothetical protein